MSRAHHEAETGAHRYTQGNVNSHNKSDIECAQGGAGATTHDYRKDGRIFLHGHDEALFMSRRFTRRLILRHGRYFGGKKSIREVAKTMDRESANMREEQLTREL